MDEIRHIFRIHHQRPRPLPCTTEHSQTGGVVSRWPQVVHVVHALQEFSKRHIIIYTLPPNSTHILQPMWKLTVREFQREHPNTVMMRVNFVALIDKMIGVMVKESTIRNGYAKCTVDVPAPIATHTPAGMTVTLNQEIIDLDNTLSYGELSSAEKADLFPHFWALINVAITNATKNANQATQEKDNGQRDDRKRRTRAQRKKSYMRRWQRTKRRERKRRTRAWRKKSYMRRGQRTKR